MSAISPIPILSVLGLALGACRAAEPTTHAPPLVDLPVSVAPHACVEASYKERIDQPYVFRDLVGSYADTGRHIADVLRAMREQGLEPSGPPFALYYDDPGTVSVSSLRSRACVPVADEVRPASPLAFEVLPCETVAYAFVGGAYADVPRAYPGIYAFLGRMGWSECGPIREIYLVPPGSAASWDELVCEVQIPAAPRR
jgi:effector-binding domain-containing protein